MLEHSYFSDFDDNDVVAFSETNLNKAKQLKDVASKFRDERLESNIAEHFKNYSIVYPKQAHIGQSDTGSIYHANNWTKEGIHCEVLKLGSKEWRKGKIKVRISVEFYTDEPEVSEEPPSPLDDIRQSMS
jgi:hypothetical protein